MKPERIDELTRLWVSRWAIEKYRGGFWPRHQNPYPFDFWRLLVEEVAREAAEEEREACASVAKSFYGGSKIEDAIRARSGAEVKV